MILDGAGKRVKLYKFSSSPSNDHRLFQNVYLIIKPRRGFSLQEIKNVCKRGTLSLNETWSRNFAFMTTRRPKGNSSSWASRTAQFYKNRWLIETNFSDLNRINHRWRSSHDNVRYLDMLVRILLYNSWKMNKKLL